jgi:hypothetical protein
MGLHGLLRGLAYIALVTQFVVWCYDPEGGSEGHQHTSMRLNKELHYL